MITVTAQIVADQGLAIWAELLPKDFFVKQEAISCFADYLRLRGSIVYRRVTFEPDGDPRLVEEFDGRKFHVSGVAQPGEGLLILQYREEGTRPPERERQEMVN